MKTDVILTLWGHGNQKIERNHLRKHFWKEYTFGTNGHFAFNAGNVSEEMLKKYIENQGGERR